ncbi:ABC transporter permease [Nocardia terpenica]|uniref:ABC transporter permease n=1 Tax=Nocardia terpenica TaxID=455432 RepID=UPI001894CF60|nr:ABC transporter permease [Nocardia terpenica]MBF6061657.1 ABC transporter permease [Nocardia terpenica]MBF6107548.1 ABC transporter permease [Nocardia terpenica]MBF6110077.1 ABC transporter permease [Nocardia terpenica]MBF6122411.1 ABC transporter permease [Nocardia terpenica]MBF6151413.1 ABC transporter permease [Nocardia terpenica]
MSLPRARMTWGLAFGQLRQYRRQTVLVLIISTALLAALLIPAGLYVSYRDKVTQSLADTVLPGELIVTAAEPLASETITEALRSAPGACALSQITGQVVLYSGGAASQSIPGTYVRSDGPCANAAPGPGEVSATPATDSGPGGLAPTPARDSVPGRVSPTPATTPGPGEASPASDSGAAGVMGVSGARAAVGVNTSTPEAAAAVRFGNEALAREILGVPAGYTLVALAGPDAGKVADRLAAAGGTVNTRAAYLDGLTSQQLANVSFLGVIAITFAVVLIGGLAAALAFSLALLAMHLRPQLATLRRIGVPRTQIRTAKAIQAALLLTVAAVAGTAIAFAADATVPAGRVLLGTFPVDGVTINGPVIATSLLALTALLTGAWFLGDAISTGPRETTTARPRFATIRRVLPFATREALPSATREALPSATREALPSATREALPSATREALPSAVTRTVLPLAAVRRVLSSGFVRRVLSFISVRRVLSFISVRRVFLPVLALGSFAVGIWSAVTPRFGFAGLVVGYCLVLAGLFVLAAPALRVFGPFGEVGAARGVLLPWFGIGSVARVRAQAAVAVSCIGFTATLVAIVSVFATSTDVSINRQIDANVGAQVVVEPKTGFAIAGSDVTALRGVSGVAGVVAVVPRNGVDVQGGTSNGVGIDGPLDSGTLQITMTDGAATANPGEAMLSATEASKLGARVGDSITVAGVPVRVSGIYRDAPTLGDFVVHADLGAGFQYVLIRTTDPNARTGIDTVAAGLPNLAVRSISEYVVQQKEQTRVIIAALTQLSIVVGAGLLLALGVVLGVLTGGRLKEWATLRQLGFSRGLVLRSVGIEGAVVATVGVLAGLAVGSAFGYAVCKYLRWAGLTDVVLDPVTSAAAGACLIAVGIVVYLIACSSTLRQLR